jgi:hypothetical protein
MALNVFIGYGKTAHALMAPNVSRAELISHE